MKLFMYKKQWLISMLCIKNINTFNVQENLCLTSTVYYIFTASDVMHQVVQGLKYLHSHYILHRDMTLSNLLLTKDMRVVSIKILLLMLLFMKVYKCTTSISIFPIVSEYVNIHKWWYTVMDFKPEMYRNFLLSVSFNTEPLVITWTW